MCMSILNRLFLDFETELSSLLLTPLSLFFISLSFLAALGLCSCAWVFSSWDGQGLLSNCGHRLLIAVAPHRRARALGTQVSVVVACGLSCPTACEICLDLGLNPRPPHWQEELQPLDHYENPLCFCVLFCRCPIWSFHLPTAKSFVFHGLTPSLNKYILSIYYEPGVLLDAKTTVISKRKTVTVLLKLVLVFKKKIHKQIREPHTVISALKEQGRSEWELIPLI